MQLLDKKDVLEAIAMEPEYPGDAPPQLMECINQLLDMYPTDRVCLLVARLAAGQTKRCIAERIETLPEQKP